MVALAVVETLLVGRLAFLLAEANANNGFVNFIYDVSKPLAEPFQGIVANSGNLEYASAHRNGRVRGRRAAADRSPIRDHRGPRGCGGQGRYQPHGREANELMDES